MAKRKRRSKRKDDKRRQSDKQPQRDDEPSTANRFPANPPKPNFVLLVSSGVLVIAWLIYLLVVVIYG